MSDPVEQPEPKRRRRSGWDVQTPAPSAEVDEAFLKQQAQQAYMAQQLALQKAQQAIAQQALQRSLGVIAVNLPKPGCRVYVGSIHYDLREPDIVTLFSTFGTITKSEMTMDPQTGRSKGFCFLEFADPACAEAAMAMDGFELAGRKIKVGRPLHGQQQQAAAQLPQVGIPGLGLPGLGLGLGALGGLPVLGMPGAAPLQPPPPPVPAYVPTPDDDKLSCVLISNIATGLSLKDVEEIFKPFGTVVQCKEVLPSATASSSSSGGSGGSGKKRVVVEYTDIAVADTTATSMDAFDLAGAPLRCEVVSRLRMSQLLSPSTMSHTFCCVLLDKMVTLEDTNDPGLKDEIAEEAQNYGDLKDVVLNVDKEKGEVEVKLIYRDAGSAAKAHKAMNGRAFAGNKIIAVLSP